MLKHILVTLDGSELAEEALGYARQIVAPDGRITLLSVLDFSDLEGFSIYEVPMLIKPEAYRDYIGSAELSARHYLSRTGEQLQQQTGIRVDFEYDSGDPAAVIVNRAAEQKVDAIVMSTHGRSGISRWLFGSVTQKVLSAMPCPVFVVPGAKKVATQEHRAATPEPAKA